MVKVYDNHWTNTSNLLFISKYRYSVRTLYKEVLLESCVQSFNEEIRENKLELIGTEIE